MSEQPTDAAASPLTLTQHEIAALTSLVTDPAGRRSAHLLDLDSFADNDDLLHAGVATLLVRGLAEVSEGRFRPIGKASVVGAILGSATDWLRLHFGNDSGEGVTAIVRSELASLFLEVNEYGLYRATPLDASVDVLELAGAFLGAGEMEPAIAPPLRLEITRLMPTDETTVAAAVEAETWTLEGTPAQPPAQAWRAIQRELGYDDGADDAH